MAKNTNKNSSLAIIKKELLQDKIALASVAFLLVLTVVLIISVFTVDLDALFEVRVRYRMQQMNLPPSREFWLGTNRSGVDVFSLLLIATRNSLIFTVLATIFSSIIGVVYGLISGYLGGRVDNFMNTIIDLVTSIPNLLALMILISFFGGLTWRNFILTISLIAWTGVAKVVRASVIKEKNLDYIVASKTLGTPHLKIIFKKLLPNLSTVIIAATTINAVAIVIMETSLTFFNIGTSGPGSQTVYTSGFPQTLGSVLSLTGYTYILRSRWWIWVPAAMMVVLIMFSINSIGNMLTHASDVNRG